MKIRPRGGELFHTGRTDGQTDGYDTANSRFSQFRECPPKYAQLYLGLFILLFYMCALTRIASNARGNCVWYRFHLSQLMFEGKQELQAVQFNPHYSKPIHTAILSRSVSHRRDLSKDV